jgi:hypothetical protein
MGIMKTSCDSRTATLFRPFIFKHLILQNRIVMAPMTRSKSPGGIPGADVAAYYRRRAEGEVGLIVTEGTYIPHLGAGFYPDVPHFYGKEPLAGWKRVVQEVHAAGGKIFPQIWHVGLTAPPGVNMGKDAVGPSGLLKPGEQARTPMTQQEIDDVIQAYGKAAASAELLGFDGLGIHGAHGYLIDQFFWESTVAPFPRFDRPCFRHFLPCASADRDFEHNEKPVGRGELRVGRGKPDAVSLCGRTGNLLDRICPDLDRDAGRKGND